MDLAAQHLMKKQLLHVNMCQMVVQMVTILDLTTHDGLFTHKKYFNGQEGNSGRCSNYLWPKLAYPPCHYWPTWCSLFLSQVIGYPLSSSLLAIGMDYPNTSMISNTNSTQLVNFFTNLMKNKKCGHNLNDGTVDLT